MASMFQLSSDASFHFEMLRPMSLSVYDGGDLAEVLTAIQSIIPSDLESFCSAFTALANRVYERAQHIASSKFPVSARTAFFSAATYFRAADFFLHGNASDPRIMDLWARQTDAFDRGLALLPHPAQRLTIPTANFDIPAIWFTPDHKGQAQKRPTLLLGNGYDGSQEEMYHMLGLAALERGYNVLSYEGPGQPSVRRYQNLGFIPDWERVVTPIVDHLLRNNETYPSVDPDALGLVGLSFGGYLAPRAAALEHRFAAVMAVDGVWDFGLNARTTLGPDIMRVFDAGNRSQFNDIVMRFTQPGQPAGPRWAIQQGMWAFCAEDPFDYVSQIMEYSLEDVIHQVRTPVLVGLAQDDIFFPGQAELLAGNLGEWGQLYNFKDADYIGTHCGIGSLKQHSAVILDWFQNVLDSKK